MNNILSFQYNDIANRFNKTHDDFNYISNNAFFSYLANDLSGKKLLDIGCGDGNDFDEYLKRGATVVGIDPSKKLQSFSKHAEKISFGLFENIPFTKNNFDIVVSKYALQTSEQVDLFYNEANRVLKPGGELIFLVVHPMRQFFEKKTMFKNYFEKTIVDSVIFNGTITVKEPTHTISEYLSPLFFSKFTLESLYEGVDFYSAEKIGPHEYPTYLIIKAKKK